LHVHTTCRVTAEPLERCAAAAERGYEYLAITDHAEDLAVNGVSREELEVQRSRLEACGALPEMALLHGTELNIGPNGSVDYDQAFLTGLEWTVAGVHSHFELDREAQTRRIVTPCATRCPAIAHLKRTQDRRRPASTWTSRRAQPAEETGTALEINCHLDRLDASVECCAPPAGGDLPHQHRRARHPGVGQHRLGGAPCPAGWLAPDRVANTWPANASSPGFRRRG